MNSLGDETHQANAPTSIHQVYVPFNQLVGEVKGGELVTGVLAGAAAAEDTDAVESRRLCGGGGLRKMMIPVFHFEQVNTYSILVDREGKIN